MSNCYKNFSVTVSYKSSTDTIYANSVSLSESIDIQNSKSLGVKTSENAQQDSVYSIGPPKGQISIESYLLDGLSSVSQLKGLNDQDVTVKFGPYSCSAPCLLSSISVNIDVGQPITVNRTFNYFGGVSVSSANTPTKPNLSPIIPDNLTLNGFQNLGELSAPKSISWTFSQTYQEHYFLGDPTPIIVFDQGQIELNVRGEGIASQLTQQEKNCLSDKRSCSIGIKDCAGTSLGSLSADGYLQSRSASISTENDEENSVSIIQYL